MPPKHLLIAKIAVGILAGLAVGYGVGISLQHDAVKGRALTMEQYVADFQRYKGNLESSEIPMPVALVFGTFMVCGAFALYEVFALGLARIVSPVLRSSRVPPAPPAMEG
jgi:hypothetical protein